MNVSLDTYVVCRVALAHMMLLEPHNTKYRVAFDALRQSLVDENDTDAQQDPELRAVAGTK